MNGRKHFAFGLVALAVLHADRANADATEPLDKVAAVVGEQPIFLSEVRHRARPHVYVVDARGGDVATRTAAKAGMMREVLERIIDERLEEREADKAHLTVTPDEVDQAIQSVATTNKMTKETLFAEAKRQGVSEMDYRDEIRRQILEGKLIQLRVRGRVKVTEADAKTVYGTWVKEQTGPNAPIDLRILVLRIAGDPAAKKATEDLAKQILSQARSGTDFCSLVTKHSQDPTTTSSCGSRGPLPRSQLLPELAKATSTLKPGETIGPLSLTDPASAKVLLVVQNAPGALPPVASFEKVKEEMMQRALMEATDRERKAWLEDLRKKVFIEVKP